MLILFQWRTSKVRISRCGATPVFTVGYTWILYLTKDFDMMYFSICFPHIMTSCPWQHAWNSELFQTQSKKRFQSKCCFILWNFALFWNFILYIDPLGYHSMIPAFQHLIRNVFSGCASVPEVPYFDILISAWIVQFKNTAAGFPQTLVYKAFVMSKMHLLRGLVPWYKQKRSSVLSQLLDLWNESESNWEKDWAASLV